ncbi:hypothetical protein VIBRN418_01658 [Vibrio sp. N418]|uniref:hypothetical protein n=1 Tax=Vibrio sp. (strain N418) TaxID=701176 RepID=UPI00021C0770|nr:hypothetical protein [Vibrio sp. N418]EGU31488.1 hypothetical protein VIBRN418_01658 [Vibrio sp. N418]
MQINGTEIDYLTERQAKQLILNRAITELRNFKGSSTQANKVADGLEVLRDFEDYNKELGIDRDT